MDATVVEKICVEKDAKALEQIPSNGASFFFTLEGHPRALNTISEKALDALYPLC